MTLDARPATLPPIADERAVCAALNTVPDPEIPVVSVVDLGIVHGIELSDDRLRVELLPTFVGCPAVEAMRAAVADRLAGSRPTVEVEITFAEPWTSDRITVRGRRRLQESGFAPPEPAGGGGGTSTPTFLPVVSVSRPARCPHCGSRDTRLESAFGPTLCRSIHHCLDCRQPFEQFKTV